MDLEKINRKHFMETDMYYRVGYGLSSKLLDYRNGIIFIEISIGRKWDKSHNATAHELAYCWKDAHKELSKAIACKVFIIDAKKNRYKQTLISSGIKPSYDAKKGVIFSEYYMN
jgi:hypothetical protein